MSCIADKLDQTFFEFRSGRSRKGKHQQLFVFNILEQKQGSQFVYQDTRFAASGACGDDNVARILVVYYLLLAAGESAKNVLVFGRCNILVDLFFAIFLEILVDEAAVIHREVVADILQRGLVVANHHIGILADDMNLLDALLVELVQKTIVFLGISGFSLHLKVELHSVIDNQEAPFDFQQFIFTEEEQSLLHI